MGPSHAELIINPDGSIYHLSLRPEDIAPIIILVGDPDRVPMVSKYFDRIELIKAKREFITHTGTIGTRRLSVLSTGIGTDNIDIVLNELDALANFDLKQRSLRESKHKLKIIRVGTSGTVQKDIPLDSFLLSDFGMGLDGLLQFYESESVRELPMETAFIQKAQWPKRLPAPYVVKADTELMEYLDSEQLLHGITATLPGFYAPQNRSLRLTPYLKEGISALSNFEFEGNRITNLEMETAGIYGLSALLGHAAVSLNCILANRANGTFSKNPGKAIDHLIRYTLEKLTDERCH